MEEISQELVARAIDLVRRMGGNSSLGEPYANESAIRFSSDHYDEARAIVAMLPVPVDPLLVEARALCLEVVADIEDAGGLKASFDYWYQTYHSGACDKHKDVQRIYARLRQLALKARAGEGSV